MHRMLAAPGGLPLHEALGRDENGFTPLHLAALSGNVPAAVTLIQEMEVGVVWGMCCVCVLCVLCCGRVVCVTCDDIIMITMTSW